MDIVSNERLQQYMLDNGIKEAWLGLIQSLDGNSSSFRSFLFYIRPNEYWV